MNRPAFVEHCCELLAALGTVRAKRMFGGHGLYVDELFVAIVAAERLYLKTDAQTQPRFEAAGCAPFVYDAARGAVATSYWSAPDDALESPALMLPWARLALAAALRSRAAVRPRKAARARTTAAGATPATTSTKARRRRATPAR